MNNMETGARFTQHAQTRCQQRGIRNADVIAVIQHGDREAAAGSGATLVHLSRDRAAQLNMRDGFRFRP